jgi:hypothetical protein
MKNIIALLAAVEATQTQTQIHTLNMAQVDD